MGRDHVEGMREGRGGLEEGKEGRGRGQLRGHLGGLVLGREIGSSLRALGHHDHDLSLSVSSGPSLPLHGPDRGHGRVEEDDQVDVSNVQTFLPDRGADQDREHSSLELVEDLFLFLLGETSSFVPIESQIIIMIIIFIIWTSSVFGLGLLLFLLGARLTDKGDRSHQFMVHLLEVLDDLLHIVPELGKHHHPRPRCLHWHPQLHPWSKP